MGYRNLFQNRKFLLFFLQGTASGFGYSVFSITSLWLALQLSGNLIFVGLVLFVEYGVYSLSFIAGPFVDRARNGRTVLLICYPVQAALAFLIGLTLTLGTLTPLIFVLFLLGISLLWNFVWANNNTIPPEILPKDDLIRASALSSAVGKGTSVVGYSSGAFLIIFLGTLGGAYLYAGLLIFAALVSVRLSIRMDPVTDTQNLRQSFGEGWGIIKSNRDLPLKQLTIIRALRGFLYSAPSILITSIAAYSFHTSSFAYGVLMTSYMLGGVIISLIIGRMNPRRKVGKLLVVSTLLGGTFLYLSTFLSEEFLLLAGVIFVAGLAMHSYSGAGTAYLQGKLPKRSIGRVTGNMYLFVGIANSLGALALGALANFSSIAELGTILGASYAGVGILAFLLSDIRTLGF